MDAADQATREKALFEKALDMESSAERLAFLRGACGADGALLARVQALLQAHEAAEGFLPEQPVGQATFVPVNEKPGDWIGRYKLRERIGEGGCGVVYVAEQEEPVRRKVALKVIKLGMDTRNVVARFEAERQALALMDHPNIAQVHDAGATETGRPYFVMELVRGIKITDYCDQQQLSTRERLELFIKVCQAVQHAHQKGIIHRDIKPSNILVTVNDPGSPGVPKVIDFGIAKATKGRLTDLTVYTNLHQFIGTPAYMSPEQASMTSLDIDTRSDIYSLGVLLYELLVGKTPFDSRELLAAGLDGIGRTLQEKEPARPSTRLSLMGKDELTTTTQRRRADAPKLIRLLRGDLDWIVMKCLEKDRTRRYETANGLARDIERYLNNEPVVARPPSTAYRLEKAWRRHELAFTAAVVVAAALVLGISVSSWEAVAASRARNAEREQRVAVRRELAQLHVINGVQLMQAGDYFKSLLWFTAALEIDKAIPARQEIHQMRIAAVLAQCPKLVQVISHDGRPIIGAAFSPTDDRLATIGADRTARVWEIPSGKLVMKTKPLSALPIALSFSPDGARLLIVLVDNTARLLDPATGAQVIESLPHRLGGGDNSAFPPVFDPSGKKLITQPEEKELQIWDVATGKPIGARMVHTNQLKRAQFSADGTRLLTCDTNDFGYLAWDTSTGEPAPFPVSGPKAMKTFYFSPKANVALIGGQIWKWADDPSGLGVSTAASSGSRLQTAPIGEPLVDPWQLMWATFSPNGDRLLTASRDRTARIWDTATGKPLTLPLPHDQAVRRGEFSPDGRRVATVSEDNLTRVWDADTGQPLTPAISHAASADVSAFSGSGRYFLTMHPEFLACVWDLHQERSPPVLLKPLSGGARAEVASRGGVLLSQAVNNLIRVQSMGGALNVPLHPISLKTVPMQMWFDATSRFVIVEGEMAKVQIWEAASGTPITPLIPSRYTLHPNESKNVKLPLAGLPPADATELAQLLSGSRLDGTGGWTSLKFEELAPAWERLSRKYPGLFRDSAVDGLAWHRLEAEAAQEARDWPAAAFHWQRLRAAQPTHREFAERQEYALKCLAKAAESARSYSERRRAIPPQDPQAGPRMIDLTDYYTGPLTEGVPVGLQTLAGVHFDVRGVVTLFGRVAELRGIHGPEQVTGLKVQQRCERMHLLHTARSAENGIEGEAMAVLVVNYANGQVERITIQNLVQIADDWSSEPFAPKQAQVAWVGADPLVNSFQNCVRLFKYTWPNPHPDWEISQVDLVSTKSAASYVLVAMTLE